MLVVLQLWQQWKALKIMYMFYKKDKCAEEKKKLMLKEVSSIEPFFESIPSILIMTCIWIHGIGSRSAASVSYICSDSNGIDGAYANFCAIFDGLGGAEWFFTTYGVSILAGSLGICKFLQNGPVANLPSNMMNWRFVIAFLSICFALVAKGLFGGLLISLIWEDGIYSIKNRTFSFILINVLPNILLAVIGIAKVTGFNKMMLKTIMDYPAFLVLPTFTNFAVGPAEISRCGKSKKLPKQHQIVVSRSLTAVNSMLTVICYGLGIASTVLMQSVAYNGVPSYDRFWILLVRHPDEIFVSLLFLFSPVLFMSLLFTMIFFCFDRIKKCCPDCSKCCCTFCCSHECLESRCENIDMKNKGEQDGIPLEIQSFE